jgi:hypothetical protein
VTTVADEIPLDSDLGTPDEPTDVGPPARTGVTIIRRCADRLALDVFVPLLTEHLGMHRTDAAMACACPAGIFVDNVPRAAAERLAAALRASGEDCAVVPAVSIAPLPVRQPVRAARLGRDGLALVDPRGRQWVEPWSDGLALAMGAVEVPATTSRRVWSPRPVWSGQDQDSPLWRSEEATRGGSSSWSVTKTAAEAVVDLVFADPLRCYRIEARAFDYRLLGEQQQPGSDANFLTLIRWLVHAMPQACANFDAEELLRSGRVPRERLSEQSFDAILHWLINLAPHKAKAEEPIPRPE